MVRFAHVHMQLSMPPIVSPVPVATPATTEVLTWGARLGTTATDASTGWVGRGIFAAISFAFPVELAVSSSGSAVKVVGHVVRSRGNLRLALWDSLEPVESPSCSVVLGHDPLVVPTRVVSVPSTLVNQVAEFVGRSAG